MGLYAARLCYIGNLYQPICRPAEPSSRSDIILTQFDSVFSFFIELISGMSSFLDPSFRQPWSSWVRSVVLNQ